MQLVAFSPGTVTLTLRAEDTPAFNLSTGEAPSITLTNEVMQLVLEVGVPGSTGAAATVAVGSTTTLDPGLNATVTNSGTPYAAVLNFAIPRGADGAPGTPGVVSATAPLAYNSTTHNLSIDLSAYATQAWVDAQGYLQAGALTGYATQSWVTSQGYLTSASLSGYETSAHAASTYYPLTNPAGYITATWLNAYLLKAGGDMNPNATVQFSDSTSDSQIAGWGFGVELTADPTQNASISFNNVQVQDGFGTMSMGPAGLTFPDSTVMTTAAIGGVGYTSPYLTYLGNNITAIDLSSGSITVNYVYGGNLVSAANITLLSGAGGVLTFADSTTQATAFPGYTGTSAQYIAGDGSLITFPTLATANKLTAEVYNETGATLTKGTVVYISGTHGNLPSVSKSQANAESTSAGTYGLVAADIGNMSSGTIVLAGVIENLALNAYADGDKLYLSPTVAGGYTTTKPSAPDHMVFIGVVTRAHPTLGTIQLRIANGFELEELHNVAISSVANGDLLAYESSTALWKNKSVATLGLATQSWVISQGYLTSAPVTSVAGRTGAVTLAVADVSGAAPLASPALTGVPTAPTATVGTNTTQIATTAFVLANAGSGGGGCNVQTFGSATTSGTFSGASGWQKPAGAKWVEFYIVGGGGGGGGGARWPTTSARSGGGGASGSSVYYGRVSAGALASQETVVVGAGGAGGAGRVTDNNNGTPGSGGGATTFGPYNSGFGASGSFGSTTGGTAGAGKSSFLFVSPTTFGAGGAGAITFGAGANNQSGFILLPLGGGGGGGAGASSTTASIGGSGGGFTVSTSATNITAIAGGTGGQGVSATPATDGTSATTNYFQAGTGGGGGFYRTATAGGNGGAGGWPGGGGGGGGASDNGFTSGAGGAGANGFAVIITYF